MALPRPRKPKKNCEHCTCVLMFSDPNNLRFRRALSHVSSQPKPPSTARSLAARRGSILFIYFNALRWGFTRVPKTTPEVVGINDLHPTRSTATITRICIHPQFFPRGQMPTIGAPWAINWSDPRGALGFERDACAFSKTHSSIIPIDPMKRPISQLFGLRALTAC